ncbi:MAG: hypothetical protein V1745_04430 [Patescibacteria group bacterium]
MKPTTSAIALVVASLLLGQGCPTDTAQTTSPTGEEQPAKGLVDRKAFGKLPSLGSVAVAENGTATAGNVSVGSVSARSMAVAAPMMAPADSGVTKEASVIGRPIPAPYPTPGTVTYDLDATTPSWSMDGDVLRLNDAIPSLLSAKDVVKEIGIPNQALGSDAKLLNLNLSWRDADGMQWQYDASSHMVSFWKDTSGIMKETTDAQEPPKIDDAEYVRIADAFFAAKGFSDVARGAGTVEKPWGDANVRCPMPMMEGAAVKAANVAVTTDVATLPAGRQVAPDAGVSSISRCWWPSSQVTVYYEGSRDGKRIQDAGGWPWRAANVTIDVTDKSVSSGSIVLNRGTESSQYPLISKEEAEKRLHSGGRNPLYVWESGNVSVHIKTLDLVWMRYDSWSAGANETYLIPALAGSGTATYPDGREEEYRTIIPLVTDDAFEEPTPVEILPMRAADIP